MKIKLKEAAKNLKGYSLYRLAIVLRMPQQTIYSWASGRTQPSYENLDKICEALECSVSDILEAEPVQRKLEL